jgi:hypothetical protein
MKAFLEDNHVDSYKEYLILLLGRAYETLKNPVIPYNPEDNKFFHKYIIQLSEIPHEEWNKEIGLPFFRNHFLFQLSDRSLLVVNPDLMVDKIYQGLKFMMYRSVCKHELPSPKGKPFKDFSAFSSSLGENFSEGELLGPILNQSLEKWSDLFKTGQDFRNQSIVGEPDFYIRKDDSLLLVEFKDVTLSESSKQSDDVGVVKNDILKRLCWDDGRSRKGVGQLLWNINRLKDGDFRLIDTSYMDIKNIYPILVTTDNVFSSSGVNALIEENCKQLLKQYSFSDDFTIYNPVIIDIDTLIELSYQLSEERYDIIKLIRGYYKNKYYKIISFKRYIRQYCKIEGEKLRERNKFLFGDLLQIS